MASRSKQAEQVQEQDVEQGEGEDIQVPSDSADERAKRTRAAKPSYSLKRVTALPENVKAKRKPVEKNTYRDLLLPAVEDENLWDEWLEIATFNTATGARMKMKQFEKGEVEAPGEGFEWEFAARRLTRPEGEGKGEPTGAKDKDGDDVMEKYSVLYAKCQPAE
jgi:hypothetical protein